MLLQVNHVQLVFFTSRCFCHDRATRSGEETAEEYIDRSRKVCTMEHMRPLVVTFILFRLIIIQNLPVELILQIFRHNMHAEASDPHSRRYPESAFRLSQICKRIRQVTLTSPELWTRIVIRDDAKSRARAKLVCSRSASRDVEVVVLITEQTSDMEFGDVLGILRSCGSRVRSFEIEASAHGDSAERVSIALLSLQSGNLEALKVSCPSPSEVGYGDYLPIYLPPLPRLRALQTCNLVPVPVGPFPASFGTLEIADEWVQFEWPTDYFSLLLQSASSITTLQLDDFTIGDGELPNSIVLRCLRHLRLSLSIDYVVEFLRRLDAQNLEEIEFGGTWDNEQGLVDDQPCRPSVRKVRIDGEELSFAAELLMTICPMVDVLEMDSYALEFLDDAVECMDDSDNLMWQSLSRIKIYHESPFPRIPSDAKAIADKLIRFVDARRQFGSVNALFLDVDLEFAGPSPVIEDAKKRIRKR